MTFPECIHSGGHRYWVIDEIPQEKTLECSKCGIVVYERDDGLGLESRVK